MSAVAWFDELHALAVRYGDDAALCALVAYLLVKVLKWLYRPTAGGDS